MVLTFILRRTCFSAHIQSRYVGSSTSTSCNSSSHALYHCFVVLFPYLGITLGSINGIQWFIFHCLHHVRCNEIAAVGNCCAQIGYLQRSSGDFPLSNGNRNNSQSIPRTIIIFIIIPVIRNHSSFLTRQVHAQWISKSHRHHVITPGSHGILYRAIFLSSTNHVIQSPTKISITRSCNSRNQRGW